MSPPHIESKSRCLCFCVECSGSTFQRKEMMPQYSKDLGVMYVVRMNVLQLLRSIVSQTKQARIYSITFINGNGLNSCKG